MPIFHIVMLRFKSLVPTEEVDAACARMLELQTSCVHPSTKGEYVTVVGGGRDNSPEGHENGMTHAFVFRFGSVQDRDYHVNQDPARQRLQVEMDDIVDKDQVLDFTSGVF